VYLDVYVSVYVLKSNGAWGVTYSVFICDQIRRALINKLASVVLTQSMYVQSFMHKYVFNSY